MICTDLGSYPTGHSWLVTGNPLPPPQRGSHWLHPDTQGRPPVWLVPPHWDREDSSDCWVWSTGGDA